MTADRWRRIQKLFEQAATLPPAERAAFFAQACGGDEELRTEVESLLAHDAEAAKADFLRPVDGPPRLAPEGEPPSGPETERTAASGVGAPGDGASPPYSPSPPLTPSPHIEGYEFLRELNRGGQGIIYQALQKTTKRKVAIKVLIEGSYASKSAQRRFEREIELVAQLRHPNIITVFHSGTTPEGQPFYVMDYVRGVPLHRFVRERQLGLEETLKLFSTVCEGVQYAHQRGVIHRDLKPGNILVDADGVPKIMDFGLAKVVTGAVETVVSISQQVVGTLPYMSPEQARGNPDEIDSRTDVYALGVILYELLTGHYPYPVVGQLAEVLKHITQTPPTPPSRGWKPDSGITRRSSGKTGMDHCPIDDEVQTIVLRALSKERDRRYQSAGELARDIGRYIAGEPIEAKRDSGWYVLMKALRKYKVLTAIVFASNLTGIAFGIVMMLLLHRANEQVDQAAVVGKQIASTIAELRIDTGDPSSVLARYCDTTSWRPFKQFGPGVSLTAAMVMGIRSEDRQLAVIGARTTIEKDDGNLAAYSADGKWVWGANLKAPFEWPDVSPLTEPMAVKSIVSANVDEDQDDELIVLATDPALYPTCISIIKPGTGVTKSTFWHTGQIGALQVVPDFFEDHRPAILAWGVNNKLDGYDMAEPGDRQDEYQAAWDMVPVVMILDPDKMKGFGPPRIREFPSVGKARPYAYAFLDRGSSDIVGRTSRDGARDGGQAGHQWASVSGIVLERTGGTVKSLGIEFTRSLENGGVGIATLVTDRMLNLVNSIDPARDSGSADHISWAADWHPIVREYEDVTKAKTDR